MKSREPPSAELLAATAGAGATIPRPIAVGREAMAVPAIGAGAGAIILGAMVIIAMGEGAGASILGFIIICPVRAAKPVRTESRDQDASEHGIPEYVFERLGDRKPRSGFGVC